MAQHIHKCTSCQSYTMEKKCPKCGKDAVIPRPPKFTPNDKYADLIREEKKKDLKKKGLY